MERLYSLKEASRLLGIHWATIERWDNEGKIRCIRLPNNYRKVPESEIRRLRGEKEKRREIIYARVSSQDQKGDLQRQIEKLKSIAPDAEVLSDVMSGMNFERKSFRKLIEGVLSGDIANIYYSQGSLSEVWLRSDRADLPIQ
jgi:predicted site-specific integrase-resolvase